MQIDDNVEGNNIDFIIIIKGRIAGVMRSKVFFIKFASTKIKTAAQWLIRSHI